MRTPITIAIITAMILTGSMTLTSFAAPMSRPTPVVPTKNTTIAPTAKTAPITKKKHTTKKIHKIERKK